MFRNKLLFYDKQNVLDVQPLPPSELAGLQNAVLSGRIRIVNLSDQSIKARVDGNGSNSEYSIKSGNSEDWSRSEQLVTVRINAYNLWHDVRLSPGSVVKLSSDFKLNIYNSKTGQTFQYDAKVSSGSYHL